MLHSLCYGLLCLCTTQVAGHVIEHKHPQSKPTTSYATYFNLFPIFSDLVPHVTYLSAKSMQGSGKVYVHQLPPILKNHRSSPPQKHTASTQTHHADFNLTAADQKHVTSQQDSLKPLVLPILPNSRWSVMSRYIAANKRFSEGSRYRQM